MPWNLYFSGGPLNGHVTHDLSVKPPVAIRPYANEHRLEMVPGIYDLTKTDKRSHIALYEYLPD